MQFPSNTTIAVADGEKLRMFRNAGNERELILRELPTVALTVHNKGSGKRHHSSMGHSDGNQLTEDGYAAATAELLNNQVLSGEITDIYVVAPPRTLGELRLHYHPSLKSKLLGELGKEHTNDTIDVLHAALVKA